MSLGLHGAGSMTRDAMKVLCKFVSKKRFCSVFFGDGRNMGSIVLGVHGGGLISSQSSGCSSSVMVDQNSEFLCTV